MHADTRIAALRQPDPGGESSSSKRSSSSKSIAPLPAGKWTMPVFQKPSNRADTTSKQKGPASLGRPGPSTAVEPLTC
jgi:hypothetical protein